MLMFEMRTIFMHIVRARAHLFMSIILYYIHENIVVIVIVKTQSTHTMRRIHIQ